MTLRACCLSFLSRRFSLTVLPGFLAATLRGDLSAIAVPLSLIGAYSRDPAKRWELRPLSVNDMAQYPAGPVPGTDRARTLRAARALVEAARRG